jgi:hypothetical protein
MVRLTTLCLVTLLQSGGYHALAMPDAGGFRPAMPNACDPLANPPLASRTLEGGEARGASSVEGAVLRGTVVDARTGAPVVGAQVSVPGTRLGTVADARGAFRLRGVTADAKAVRVWFFHYLPLEVELRVGEDGEFEPLRVELTERPLPPGERPAVPVGH